MQRSSSQLLLNTSSNTSNGEFGDLTMSEQITLHELQSIANNNDPHQGWDPQLNNMVKNEISCPDSIPFEMGQEPGIVVFVAKKEFDFKIDDMIKKEYLTHARLFIRAGNKLCSPSGDIKFACKKGHEVCLSCGDEENQDGAMIMKKSELDNTERTSSDDSDNEEGSNTSNEHKPHQSKEEEEASCVKTIMSMVQFCKERANMVATKFLGVNATPPPVFNWEQTLPVLLGVFITLLVVSNINRALINNLGQDHAIVLGPVGALLTLQHGLTSAPAAQPRNIVVGQFLALIIGNSVGHLNFLDSWHKETIGVTLAIAVMVKMGVTHPPAGASAMIFSSGKYTWLQTLILMVTNIFVAVMGALLINLSDKRQYPTFWGFGPWHAILSRRQQDASNNQI